LNLADVPVVLSVVFDVQLNPAIIVITPVDRGAATTTCTADVANSVSIPLMTPIAIAAGYAMDAPVPVPAMLEADPLPTNVDTTPAGVILRMRWFR
jgi:hypothetical protein